jgi:hypothetical protein
MSAAKTRQNAPRGLKTAGKRLFSSATSEYDFSSVELELLKQLCVTVDEIAELEISLRDGGPMVPGSRGQKVLNPVYAQLVSHRKLADQLAVALALPIEGQAVGQRRSAKSKQAADSRWRTAKSRGRLNVVSSAMQKQEEQA